VCSEIEVSAIDQCAGSGEAKLYRRNRRWTDGLWPVGLACGEGQLDGGSATSDGGVMLLCQIERMLDGWMDARHAASPIRVARC
jgi:hypothetical protein